MAIEDRQYSISFECPAGKGVITTSINPRRQDEDGDIDPTCSICQPPFEPKGFTATLKSDLQTETDPAAVNLSILGHCFRCANKGQIVRITTHL